MHDIIIFRLETYVSKADFVPNSPNPAHFQTVNYKKVVFHDCRFYWQHFCLFYQMLTNAVIISCLWQM